MSWRSNINVFRSGVYELLLVIRVECCQYTVKINNCQNVLNILHKPPKLMLQHKWRICLCFQSWLIILQPNSELVLESVSKEGRLAFVVLWI